MQTLYRGYPKYFELLDGKRIAKVSPQRTHAILQGFLLELLRAAAGDRGEVGTEWKFYLGGRPGLKDALQPDVSFVSYERLGRLTRAQAEKPKFAPDIAVEIRSPDDRPGVLRRKIAKYLAKGAILVVEVHPEKNAVRAHSADGFVLFGEGERFASDAAPWFSFEVAELFAAARWRGKE